MNSINFCYWLRGFLEVAEPNKITKEQIDMINRHLDLVLTPVTTAAAPKGLQRDYAYVKPLSDYIESGKTPYNTSTLPSMSGSLLDNKEYQQAFCNYGPEGSC